MLITLYKLDPNKDRISAGNQGCFFKWETVSERAGLLFMKTWHLAKLLSVENLPGWEYPKLDQSH